MLCASKMTHMMPCRMSVHTFSPYNPETLFAIVYLMLACDIVLLPPVAILRAKKTHGEIGASSSSTLINALPNRALSSSLWCFLGRSSIWRSQFCAACTSVLQPSSCAHCYQSIPFFAAHLGEWNSDAVRLKRLVIHIYQRQD